MTELVEPTYERRIAFRATGLLATFNRAGILDAADVHVAERMGELVEEPSETARLAAALAVRAVRHGSVCVDLRTIADLPVEEEAGPLPWPEPQAWLAEVGRSRFVSSHLLRLDSELLYLDRYWADERQVCDDLLARLARPAPEVDEERVESGLLRVFPGAGYAEQRDAARRAVGRWTSVLTGGPGTGKTTAVAGMLALVAEQFELEGGELPRIALAAPTGKAAARLQGAVQEAVARFAPEDRARLGRLHATTLHRLLGSRYPVSSVRFRHNRTHRLPHDIVVVDEASMLSLTMAARLLEALRPETRLVLVGDPDQLASVDAGAVLADLVRGLAARADSPVITLRTVHRFGGRIAELAAALRRTDDGDGADEVIRVIRSAPAGLRWIDPEDADAMAAFRADVHARASELLAAGRRGEATELERHRLLCAHRDGPYGVSGWNREIERMLAEDGETHVYREWYAGRPVLVSANDAGLALYNGDMGLTVIDGDRLRVLVPGAGGDDPDRRIATTRMPEVQTAHAMTVHKSQGSQAHTVSVVLPPESSPLLTRELLYTAITRAQREVRLVGTEAAIRAAVGRTVQRVSGLAERLRGHTARTDGG